jgi:hypothetical protein
MGAVKRLDDAIDSVEGFSYTTTRG